MVTNSIYNLLAKIQSNFLLVAVMPPTPQKHAQDLGAVLSLSSDLLINVVRLCHLRMVCDHWFKMTVFIGFSNVNW